MKKPETIEAFKELILWAKEQKIRRLKITDTEIEVSFSNAAVYPPDNGNLGRLPDTSGNIEKKLTTQDNTGSSVSSQEDSDLYWSAE